MHRTITIGSQKGGVGKTTTALNLGYSLSRLGHSVLIVDADPQGGLSLSSNLKKRTTRGIVDVLKDEAAPGDIIMQSRIGNLSIAGIGTLEPEDVLRLEDEARQGGLGSVLRDMARGYDYVIIDSPAGVGGIVSSLLEVSESTMLVVRLHALALKTIPSFLKLVKWIKQRANSGLFLEGVVVTMFDRRNQTELELYEEVKNSFSQEVFFRTTVPYDEGFERSSLKSVPAAMLKGAEAAARAYMELAMELKEREAERQAEDGVDEDSQGLF